MNASDSILWEGPGPTRGSFFVQSPDWGTREQPGGFCCEIVFNEAFWHITHYTLAGDSAIEVCVGITLIYSHGGI